MSNTFRKHVYRRWSKEDKEKIYYSDARDGFQGKQCFYGNKKMKTYSPNRTDLKFEARHDFNTGQRSTGSAHKENIRNANRSRKKSMRQYLKKELQKEIELIDCEDSYYVDDIPPHFMSIEEVNNYLEYHEKFN